MALAGWHIDNRYKITIDNSKIDSGLVDFPVAIVISSGTGTNNLDATNIFDTLGSDANRTKIAVTDVNDNQLYTEIEDWDTANERACLWVKVPTVSDSADTIIYLYYDATQSGNGSYVGDTGDIPAQSVWDDYFELVMHMAQDPKPWDVFSYSGVYGPDRIFDEDNTAGSFWEDDSSAFPNWAEYDFGLLNKQIIVEYAVSAGDSEPGRMPRDWTFRGSNNYTDWDVLDTQTSQSFAASETKTYSFANSTYYRYYRTNITAGNHGTILRLFGLEFRTSVSGSNVAVARAIFDSTSNTNHGEPFNFESVDLVDATVGKAIDFDGTAEYITVPDDDTLTFGNGASADDPLTFECFANADDISAFRMIIKRLNSGGEYYFTGTGGDDLQVNLYDVNTSNRISHFTNATITEGSWEHYAAVYTGNESQTGINLFVGGVDVAETNNPGGSYSAMHNTVTDIAIGGDVFIGSPTYSDGRIGEVRISRYARSQAWLKATIETLNDNLLSFEFLGPTFTFSNVVPVHLSTVYGTTQQLRLTTVVSGGLDDYVYDAVFYDGNTDIQIGSTAGIASGSPASMVLDTPSGIDYYWYMQATSSGQFDTSSTYSFTNRFLCAGDVYVNAGPASGIPIRLYRRSTGELIGQTTSTGVVATFEIASTYNEDHYAVALYSDDATNALIYDWISPE